jgi:hypothetical protein
MKFYEKPLEHTRFTPALRFGCFSDTDLKSKYIIFNRIPQIYVQTLEAQSPFT